MLGKNNFNERLRKMEMQAKQDRFSIRKLSIGAASVLLGFTFFGINSQSVQADTVTPAKEVETANNQNVASSDKQTLLPTRDAIKTASGNKQQAKKANNGSQKLDTYAKLSKFLRDSDGATVSASDGNVTKPTATPSDAVKPATSSAVTPAQKPADAKPAGDITGSNSVNTADTASGIAANNNATAPADTNKPADDKLPANTDITATSAKPGQKPVTTNPAATGVSITNGDKPTAPDQDDKKKQLADAQDGQTAYVSSWKDLLNAFSNTQITKIEIMQDIVNDANATGDQPVTLSGDRSLTIESNPADNKRYIIDFKNSRVSSGNKGSQGHLTLSYDNLTLYCASDYGVADSYFNVSTFNFTDVDFHGNQMVYAGNNDTDIHFFGHNTAETVPMPYTSQVDGTKVNGDGEDQQLFEFQGNSNQSLTFEKGSTFVGTTTYGNVIEMHGTNSKVTLEQGAQVTLNPAANADGSKGGNSAQNTTKAAGIYMTAKGQVLINEDANLNINVGQTNENAAKPNITDVQLSDQFTGKVDYHEAAAIILSDAAATITVQDGGAINVKTNGDVSDNGSGKASVVVYDGGNIQVNSHGALNITGTNMQKYAGTLLYIAGQADLENGTLNLSLEGEGAQGSGTGASTLVDLDSSKGVLTVNNPQSLILDAHANKAASIIGNSDIKIMNVRQVFDFPGLPQIILPPFHILDVKKTTGNKATIGVNRMELLNGTTPLTHDMITGLVNDISTDPTLAGLGSVLGSALGGQDPTALLTSLAGISFDEIFPAIIQNAFSNPDNPGYNYIHMIPANPSGFLGIQDAKVTVNKDGSRTISGSITGYDKTKDGPKSDTVFNKLVDGGTDAYVIAKFNSTGSTLDGQTWKSPYQVDKPTKTGEFSSPYASTDLVGNPQTLPAGLKIDGTKQTLTVPKNGMKFNGTNVPGNAVLDFKNHAVLLGGNKVASLPANLAWPLPDGMGSLTLPFDLPFVTPVSTNDPKETLSTEFAAKVNGDNTFSFTIPTDVFNKLMAGAQLELTPEANFVGYANDAQPYSVDLLKKSFKDTVDDERKQLDQAYQDALNILADSGLDPDGTYRNEIDQAYHAAIAGGTDDTNPNPDKTNSIYGVTDDNSDAAINDVINRAQSAIDTMYHNAYDGKLDKFVSDHKLTDNSLTNTINAEKNKINAATGKDAINKAEQDAETALTAAGNIAQNKAKAKEDIQKYIAAAKTDLGKAGVDTTNFISADSGFTDNDINTALATIAADGSNKDTVVNSIKQKVFAKYNLSLPNAITNYAGNKGKELTGLTLPAGSTYQSDINNAKSDVAKGLTFKGDGSEFTGSTNVANAKTAIDLTVAKANAASEVQKYASSVVNNYPSCGTAINKVNNTYQATIKGETTIADLQDTTHANANADNHDQISDVKNGIAAIDQAIQTYKDGLKKHITVQINGGTDNDGKTYDSLRHNISLLEGKFNSLGLGTDLDIINGIKKLNNNLDQAASIAGDQTDSKATATIDKATKEGDTATAGTALGEQKKAQDLLDQTLKYYNALNKLVNYTNTQASKKPAAKPDIVNAAKEAAKNIFNATDTDANGNGPIEAAEQDGEKAIDDIIKYSAASDAIENAATQAHTRVNNSHATVAQKAQYNKEIDDAKTAALNTKPDKGDKNSIYGSDKQDFINNRQQRVLNRFNKAAAKAEVAGFAEDAKAVLGAKADTAIDAARDNATADKGTIDNVSDAGTTAPDTSSQVQDAENAAKLAILAALKDQANAKLSDKETEVGNKLDALSDNLTPDQIASGKSKAHDFVTNANGTGATDHINADESTANAAVTNAQDQAAKDAALANGISSIKTDLNNGLTNLNGVVTDATNKANRAAAIAAVNAEHQNVVDALNDKTKYPDLTDEHRKQLIANANTAWTNGLSNLATCDDDQVDAQKSQAIKNLDDILTDADSLNSTDKTDTENALNTAKQTAKQNLDDAKTAAENKVNGFTDAQVSPTDKTDLISQIEHDYQTALGNINAAKTPAEANTAEQTGATNMAQDANKADLIAAKQDAINKLNAAQIADNKVVDDALADGKITQQQHDDMISEIDSYHTQGTTAIKNETDKSKLDTDANKYIDLMNGVTTDIDNLTLANNKNDAITQLQTAANKAKEHIDGLTDLGTDEKNVLKDKVETDFGNAKDAVNSATSINDVTSALNTGNSNIQADQTAADVQNAKNAANKKLDQKLKDDNAAIDALTNLDSTSKDALKQKIKQAHDDAQGKVNDSANTDLDNIAQAATDGCDNMDKVVDSAQGLDQVKQNDKADLDQAAQEANDRIDKSDLDDQSKADAHKAINDARDHAKQEIDKPETDTIDKANKAESDGLDAIATAEANANSSYLAGLKDQADKDIDAACDAANTVLDNEWTTLSDQEKTDSTTAAAFDTAHKAIEAARTNRKNQVTAAKDKTAIDNAVNGANIDVNNAKKPALLASAKIKGKDKITQYGEDAKDKLPNPDSTGGAAKIDKLVSDAVNEINNDDQTPDDVTKTINDYKDKIDKINSAASATNASEISAAQQEAIVALDHKLNGNGKDQGVLDQIDALKDHLTSDQLNDFEQQAQSAHDDAVDAVNGDATVAAIEGDRDAGLTNIQEALDDAKLQAAKNDADKKLDQAAQNAIDQINKIPDDKLSQHDKQTAIDNINHAISKDPNGGKYQINNAKDQNAINSIVSDTEDTIINIVSGANDTAHTAAVNDAKSKLEALAQKIKDRISDDLAAGKLSQTQANGADGKGGLNKQVDDALSDAEGKIDAAKDHVAIDAAEAAGETALNAINDDVTKDEAQKADLDKVAAEVQKANDAAKEYIDKHPNMTPEQQQQVYNQINSIKNEANSNINHDRSDADDPIGKMDQDATDGVNKLSNLLTNWDNKEQAIEKLKQHASDVKNGNDGTNGRPKYEPISKDNPDFANLTDSDIANAQAAVHDAQRQGENTIFGLDTSKNDLDQTEKDCETAIDNALLPYKLLNEKNKQTAALNDYAKQQEDAIDKLVQSEDNPNGLTPEEIADYKQQIETARQNAATNINDVSLPDNPVSADYDTGKTNVAAAESDGEKAIDQILNNAKLDSKKRQDLADIQTAANEAKTHDGVDQAAIDKLVSDATTAINDATDTTGPNSPDGIKDTTKDKIQNLVDQAAIGGHKSDAAKKLKQEKEAAEAIIDRSQLTTEQKKAAKQKIKEFYDNANDQLANIPTEDANGNKLPTSVQEKLADAIQQKFNDWVNGDILSENANNNYPWFANEADNALNGTDGVEGLDGQLDALGLSETQKSKYKDLIATVNDSIAKLDKSKDGHATSIADATNTYDAGLTALNKLKAIKEVENAQAVANNAIDTNNNLTPDQKKPYQDQVDKDAQTAINNILGVTPNDSDTIGNQHKIDAAKGDVINDMNTVTGNANAAGAGALADAKNKAKQKLDNAYEAAKQKLGSAYQQGGTLDQAHDHEVAVLNGLSLDGLKNVDDGIKNIDKAAVDDAASYANDQIDKGNLPAKADHTLYTDAEKQALKDQVAKEQATGKNNIDHSTVNADESIEASLAVTDDTNASGARNNAIDKIGNDYKDISTINGILDDDPTVQRDRAKAQAEKDLATIYQAAKDKLPKGADTSALDAAFNNNKTVTGSTPEEIKHNAEKAQREIAKGAVQAAAQAARDSIGALKHDDNTPYTDAEKQVLNALITQDVNKANSEIANAAKDKEGIGQTEAEQATGDGSVSGILNDNLAIIASDATGSTDAAQTDISNDPAVQKERAKKQAEKDLQTVYDAAVNKLKEQYGPNADTTEVDKALNNHAPIDGDSVEAIKEAAQKAEQAIAHGAVTDGVTNGKNKIKDLKHEDGSSYTEAEQNALNNLLDQDAITANETINHAAADLSGISVSDAQNSTNGSIVSGALNNGLNTIANDSTGSTEADHNAISNDSAVQKERAKAKLQADYDKAVQELHDKFGKDADTSKIDAANTAAQAAIDKLGNNSKPTEIAEAEQAGEVGISKGLVQDAQTAANKLIANIKHQDTQKPYTTNEQTALTNAVQDVVNKANGTDSNKGSLDSTTDIDKTRKDVLQNILDIVTDGTDKNQAALNNDQNVKHDRELQAAKDQAEKDLQTVYDAAKVNLPDGADRTNLDNAFNNHTPIDGDSVAAIKEAARKAEQAIAKGAVKDAAIAAKNNIKNLKHKDGSSYTADEQAALNKLIDQNVANANGANDKPGTIDATNANPSDLTELQALKSKDNAIVSGALNNALNTIAANGSGNSDADQTVLNTDSDLVSAAKEQAKQNVAQAGKDAAAAVDNLTNHKDGTPYTDAEKQAIKDAIQHEVDKANSSDNGSIDHANTVDGVDTAKQDAVDAINKIRDDSDNNNEDALAPIVNNNTAVQQERHDKQVARDNITAAADKARHDLGVAKGSDEAVKIDQAEQDALDAVNKVTDGKYTAAENSGLANVVDAEKDTAKDKLDTEETAAAEAIQHTSGLSQIEKDEAIANAKHKLDAAKDAIDKVSSADTDDKNVSGKQDAIQNAYNTGKDGIDEVSSDTDNLSKAKEQAKQNVAQAGKDAAAAIDKLTNHKDGTPYTDAEKQAIKDAIQHEVDKANNEGNTIDGADSIGAVDTAKQAALDAINKIKNDSNNNDEAALAPIVNGDSAVQQERHDKQAARDNITAAADKARHDLGVAKGSDEAAKIDQAEQDALDAVNKVTDGKYTAAENSGLANVVDAEKDTAKDKLGSDSAALDAIASSDTNHENVNGKQDAIKDAYNAGKLAAEKKAAEDRLKAAYKAAKDRLGNDADISALDRSYQDALNNLQGDSADELNKSELAGERSIGKGAVQSAYDTAAKKIDQMWPDDNSQTAKDKKKALLVAAQDLLDDANETDNGTIDQAHHSTGVSDARNDAIDKIKDLHSDKDTINNVVDNDKVVQIDKAHDTAVANGADQNKVQQIRDDTAEQIKHDLQNGDHEAAKQHELAGEKEIAKLTVQGAADRVKDKIDHLTNKPDGTPYTDAEKQALKDKVDQAIDDIVNNANGSTGKPGTIDQAENKTDVTTAEQNAIQEITNSISDSNLADIINKDSEVAKDNADKAIDDAVTAANTAIDNNKNWSKDQKDKLKNRVKQDAQKGKDKIKNDSDISTINRDRDDTINQIKNDYTDSAIINSIIGSNDSGSSIAMPIPPTQPTEDVTLMHNAYLYDENGKRCNKVDLKAGSVVTISGKQKIGDKDYFVVIDKGANDKKYYIVSTNVNSVNAELTHNAYVYNKYGQRIKKLHDLKKGKTIQTYGGAITIRGQKFYIIGKGELVKAANVAEASVITTTEVEATTSDQTTAATEKKIMHNAYLYDQDGKRANGLIFNEGTVITTTGTKLINGVVYYVLDDGLYVKAANVNAKKMKLKHNAYVYSQYGDRKGKTVLKKHKLVKTYGDPVSIHGKKYYITAKGKYVKEANFIKK
ncbi:SLAP domain-containing protein [Lactobacillus sp. ESL0677]|uniref:SLAP domain-containing protein n=1 Tax=Lactobacillus sp. ESL0677 TaxID=2983208 RepID=UPI0023F6BA6B|nr:SLAP domain-containing protein [Lactobacillus sp. ESL0677]WEV37953.1 SLAP domain-containing protein [Lactobacillus sp. ESL0677]